MMYKVGVDSFCTRLVQRKLTVDAKDEAEAAEKAIQLFKKIEGKNPSSVDTGDPVVCEIVQKIF